MKIVVVSDNHGNKEVLSKIKDMHKDAELFIHCGDSEMKKEELVDFLVVRGNVDSDLSFNLIEETTVVNKKIVIVHGHKWIYGDEIIEALLPIAKEKKADILFFGHIHRYVNVKRDNIHFINPGSVKYNKDLTNPCYAVVEIEKEDVKVKRVDI